MKKIMTLLLTLLMTGCASIDFDAGPEGAVYYEPLPYLLYSQNAKCVTSATAVVLPGKKRYLNFTSGYGSSALSADFSNGLLTKIGQTSDTNIPGTLTSIAALETAGIFSGTAESGCEIVSLLFPIEDGVPNLGKPLNLNLGQ